MKILIVEDDLTIQKQLKTLLSGSGYQVEAVADFSKVIEQLKAFGPHLVLLDIKLPGIGTAFFRRISGAYRYRHQLYNPSAYLADQQHKGK